VVSTTVSHGLPDTAVVSHGSPPLFVELFAGKGALSKAALQTGLRVVSIDHEVVQPFAPMVILDLTTESGTRILWDVLQSLGLEAVHLGLPCGANALYQCLVSSCNWDFGLVPCPRYHYKQVASWIMGFRYIG
jgi:hypothetical protein